MRYATVRHCVLLLLGASGTDALRACGDRPFLAWQLRELLRYGVEDFLLLTDAASPALDAALRGLAERLPRPAALHVAAVPPGAGSGGALWHARARLPSPFLLADGTALFDGNLAALLSAAAQDDAAVDGRVVLPATGAIAQARVGVFGRRFADALQAEDCRLDHVLAQHAGQGRVRVTTMAGRIWQPGDDAAQLAAQLRRRALLLDRDGVLNVDHGYVGTRDRFEWMPGALAAIRCATDAGWHVFVVTNQSGVARGYYDEAAVRDLLAWMAEQARQAGGTIDDTRYCPFHEEAAVAEYRRAHHWRKPAPGMLLDLIRAWELDPARCVMVGDQASDMAAAAAAGVPGHLFPGGDLLRFIAPLVRG